MTTQTQTKWRTVTTEDMPPPASFFKFEAFGDAVEGVFHGLGEEDSQFGKQTVATLQIKADGERRKIRVNASLRYQLGEAKKGQGVRIEYVSDGEAGFNARTGEALNPPKQFRVDLADGKYEFPPF